MKQYPLLEGALVALVAVACLAFQLTLPARLPTEADYEALKQVLAQEARPGDLVVLHPWWTERARLFTPQGLPVAGWQGSDEDAHELHARLWVIDQPSLPRAGSGAFFEQFEKGRKRLGDERVFGRLHLSLWENGRAKPVRWSAEQALRTAQVYLEQPGGNRQACQQDGRGHRCPNGSVVVSEWKEVRFQPRRCIRFFPPGGEARVVLEIPQLPAAASVALRAGMTWDRGYFKMPQLTPTDVGLEVQGQPLKTITFAPGLEGLQGVEAGPLPEGGSVRVWAKSQNPELRELCIEVYGFGATGAGS